MDLYRDAVLGAYRALTDANVPVQIVHEDQIDPSGVPAHLGALYWPMPSVASEGIIAGIESFVARGGRVVAEAGPGEYAPTGHRRTTVPPDSLARIFGAREVETTSVGSDERAVSRWGEFDAAWQREIVEPSTAEVSGEFADGTAAVVEHRIGAGSAVLIGGYPSIAYARGRDAATSATLAAMLGRRHASESDWEVPAAGLVTRTAIAADGSLLTFALNWSEGDARFRLSECACVLSGPAADGRSIDIPAMSAALVVARPRST
ncbi:beta-galactosidase trimerization domain-containing protein, partial [Paenibacillus sp. TAF58]